jgi:uridine kinase
MELRRLTEAIRSSQAPAGVKTRIVAIDGQGAAGKSTLASLLAQQLDAPIIQTDDFASWENPVDWWPEFIARALEPLAAGEPARYDTESREAFRRYLAYSIWIDTPRDLRLKRGLERDGEQARAQWEQWMEEEDRYVERERPADHADCVLSGDEDLWA